MSNYRRYYVPGGTYFFTVVTHNRQRFLTTELARNCLRHAIEAVQSKRPFEQLAIVLLPDHLHTVWTLPPRDVNYSLRWAQIKEAFTRRFLQHGGKERERTVSREKHRERAVWHRRFWEHTCVSEDDLRKHIDYLHWNPRKHGLISRIRDYPWSTFHRFVERGEYDIDWGGTDPCPSWNHPEWE
jgi:putative transposase